MKIIMIAAAALLCINSAAGQAAEMRDYKAADLREIDKGSLSAAAVPLPAPVLTRVPAAEDSLPLTAAGNASELVAASDILIPPNLYQMYIQDGALAVTAYRTKSFCRFSVVGSPARRVVKKGTRIKVQRVPRTDAYIEELDVMITMDFLEFNDSNFYALYCVGENPVPNGSYFGAPKFVSSVTIGEMKSLLEGYFEFKK